VLEHRVDERLVLPGLRLNSVSTGLNAGPSGVSSIGRTTTFVWWGWPAIVSSSSSGSASWATSSQSALRTVWVVVKWIHWSSFTTSPFTLTVPTPPKAPYVTVRGNSGEPMPVFPWMKPSVITPPPFSWKTHWRRWSTSSSYSLPSRSSKVAAAWTWSGVSVGSSYVVGRSQGAVVQRHLEGAVHDLALVRDRGRHLRLRERGVVSVGGAGLRREPGDDRHRLDEVEHGLVVGLRELADVLERGVERVLGVIGLPPLASPGVRGPGSTR
jgi:hypothetical protein